MNPEKNIVVAIECYNISFLHYFWGLVIAKRWEIIYCLIISLVY